MEKAMHINRHQTLLQKVPVKIGIVYHGKSHAYKPASDTAAKGTRKNRHRISWKSHAYEPASDKLQRIPV
jgi:hypothetical protein